jgi:hypothetical protein
LQTQQQFDNNEDFIEVIEHLKPFSRNCSHKRDGWLATVAALVSKKAVQGGLTP